MLVYKNFLTEDVIKALKEDLNLNLKRNTFALNNSFWLKDLTKNIPGIVNICNVSKEIEIFLLDKIREFVPNNNNNIKAMHYLWHPLSGINMHNDGAFNFGATIYLNDHWDIHWGGLLLEVENKSKNI